MTISNSLFRERGTCYHKEDAFLQVTPLFYKMTFKRNKVRKRKPVGWEILHQCAQVHQQETGKQSIIQMAHNDTVIDINNLKSKLKFTDCFL